ncbi:hypothetical protein SBW85_00520 [Vibrio plantisponsor]|uniref:Uncharacterized protein n=1 Tax=Vibrio plantisponsor TaxID=664643 RepID=A0ABU4ICH1_9VIBR|nr:hypothetical protein [Vibrio plantisponsor]MDW6016252.1 hypothetical protein [Vibrio plantisponsor]NNM42429.1 hypothetical protein [Vibrio plantisponsor]
MMGSQLFYVGISVYQTAVNSLLAIGKVVIGIDKRTGCAMDGWACSCSMPINGYK